jgi:hypothetical protein
MLYDGLQGSPLFETSEDFFHKLEAAIRFGARESRALPAPALQTPKHSVALPGTSDVIRRFNRETDWLAALMVGALVSAALILAVLVQDYHPNALDPIEEAVQAGGDLLLNANSAMVFKDVGLKGKKYTGEITSGQASSADHPPTEISSKENPSSSMEAAASVPTPVLAITSELNHINAQTNRSASSPVIWQDSAPVIRPKIHIVRNRSFVAFRYGDVKRRLIELWHQSLARSEKSRTWTGFSNP